VPRLLAPILLVLTALLSGCTRSADPLDWRIEGRHIHDLRKSTDRIVASLPAEISQEFIFCFGNIKADMLATSRASTVKEQEDRLCRRTRDKSVREILIEGYELANLASEVQLAYQSDLLVRLLKRDDRDTDTPGQSMSQRIAVTKTLIESLKQKQTKSERRLAELRATAAK
jgi:hypothetical protein